ncbi:MAG TPA: hypothetical protein PL182_09460, partial [Pseudobdellovibrionaceae bacterium]|nr:hypothetical protein [Pseudobdellovibrionaceae bacterium]
MARTLKSGKVIQIVLSLAAATVIGACRESTFDDGFDPRVFKEALTSWFFSNASDYDYDPEHIEVNNGRASLKQVDTEHAGSDFSPGTAAGVGLNADDRLALLTSPSVTATHVNSVLPDRAGNLTGYWRMDGNFTDDSGRGNHASPVGGVAASGAPKVGSHSASIGGTGDYLQMGS